jgi:peptide/nickel transport system permease protein
VLSSIAVLACVVAAALLAPVIAPIDPTLIAPAERLMPPSIGHALGTDDLGRDVLSRLIAGARVSLPVGFSVMLISAGAGTLLGVLAGWYRWADPVLMRALDGLMAVPGVLVAIAVVTALGQDTTSVVLALSVANTPIVSRVMRSTVLVIREQPYIEAAKALGQTDVGILWRRVLPNALPVLIVQASFIFASAIVAEAGLSFIGAGGDPEAPSWGSMLRDGQRLLGPASWVALAPGITLFVTVLAVNLCGDALRDQLDPRLSAAWRWKANAA